MISYQFIEDLVQKYFEAFFPYNSYPLIFVLLTAVVSGELDKNVFYYTTGEDAT